MQQPRSIRPAGWSLVELLVVLALMGFVAAVLAGAMHWMTAKQAAREAAGDFQSMVREASALARREMMPVRLAFILPTSGDALKQAGIREEARDPDAGCRLLLFTVPGRHLPLQTFQSPAGDDGPLLPIGRLPRFASTTGAWTAAPRKGGWRRWPQVVLSGDFVGIHAEQSFEVAAEKFQFRPAEFWSAFAGPHQSPYSIYPEDFTLSPYRDLRGIISSALPEKESVALSESGRLTAGELFGDQQLPHWSERAEPSNKADRVELPALDFLPDGSLACRDRMEELEFRFGTEGGKSHWVVKVRTADAEVWLE